MQTVSCWAATAAAEARTSTVLDGIRDRVQGQIEVLYHEGLQNHASAAPGRKMKSFPSDPLEDRKSIAEAVEVAKRADVIVLAIGGNEQTSREAWMLNHLGDRAASIWLASKTN